MEVPITDAVYQELMQQQTQQEQTQQQPEQTQTQQQPATQSTQQPGATQMQQQQTLQEQPPAGQPAQPPMQQEPAQPSPEDLEQAKKLLGLDAVEQELRELKIEKTRQAMASKYPDVPYELVEKEIEKVKAVNPALAESMLTNPDAMELAYKAAIASMMPKEQPDQILEGQGGGAADDNMEERIAKGEADDFTLGEYILSINKS